MCLVFTITQVLNGSYYSFMPRQRDMIIPMDPVVAVAKGHVLPVDVLVGETDYLFALLVDNKIPL